MRRSIFLVVSSSLLLSACATATINPPVPDAARTSISSTEVVVPIRQSEIYVYVPPSTANAGGQGGLLGALLVAAINAGVDSVRTQNAEKAVKPLRDALVDYKFDSALQDDIRNDLAKLPWLHVSNVRVVKEVTDATLDSALEHSKADAVLFTKADYQLSNDADVLTITLTASLFGNTDALNALRTKKTGSGGASTALANALYYNTFTFVAKPPGATSDRDNNIAIWGAQNGAAMRADLTLAMGKLSSMLAADLQTNAGDRAAGTASTLSGIPVQVVSTDGDGETVRLKGGNMEFAEKSMVAP
jgi:hypothetical protein